MTTLPASQAATAWLEANHAHVLRELDRLRLLLRRSALAGGNGRSGPGTAESRAVAAQKEHTAVCASLAALERELADRVALFMPLGRPPALDTLAQLFGLSAFERDVLLLCAAPELDAGFRALYAFAQDDPSRPCATADLALALLASEATSWPAARASLGEGGPLRRFGLVFADDARADAMPSGMRALRVCPRLVDYILGYGPSVDPSIERVMHPVAQGTIAPADEPLVQRLHGWVTKRVEATGRWPVVNLVGTADADQEAVAFALCTRLRVQLHRVQTRPGEPLVMEAPLSQALEREAVLLQSALYAEARGAGAGSDPGAEAWAQMLAERVGVLVIVASSKPLRPAGREVLAVGVSAPDAETQHWLWQRALRTVPNNVDGLVSALVHQFDFGAESVRRAVEEACHEAALRAGTEAAGQVTIGDLWAACRRQGGRQVDDLAQRIVPVHTWNDIVLPADTRRQLEEVAAQVGLRAKVYDTWGFGSRLTRGRGISVLFSGPSGTGKTMAAEVLANALSLDLYRVDLSGVVSKYIGETEKNLRRVFEAAERTGAILFFDEADALFGKRSEVKDSHDRYANIEVSYLLQRMEEYRGVAILATNMKAYIDHAFLRRLRFHIEFPFPEATQRRAIWQGAFPAPAVLDGLDFERLSHLEIAGGHIRNAAVNAAFLAAAQDVPIRMEHVWAAVRSEYAKIDKLATDAELGSPPRVTA